MAYTFKHGDRPLDDYTIQRAVGRGGFGEVYYAVSDGGREVALKYLRENPQVELRGVSHCINLKSPHLVSIFDVKQTTDGEYIIIMEYCSGPSLRDLLIAEPNGFGPDKAAFFTREIAKGLAYLHERGIVHRDLKPGNIFYDDGYVKIGDYGLSKFISVSRHSAQTASVGTVHYMAPEIGSGNYSRGVDIYALGVMLYEMLLGKVPFEGSSMAEVLMKHLTAQPELDRLPQPFGKVIRKALQKDPKERYPTVDEMVEELLAGEEIQKSLAGFRPQSLSGAVARGGRDREASPSPSPNPPPRIPRAAGAQAARRAFVPRSDTALPDRVARRIDKISRRIERKMGRLAGRAGVAQPARAQPGTKRARTPDQGPIPWAQPAAPSGQRAKRFALTSTLTIGLAVGLGFTVANAAGSEELGAAAGLLVVMMRLALALADKAYRWFTVQDGPSWAQHLVTAFCAAPLLAVGVGPLLGSGDGLALWLGLLAVTVLACWRRLVEDNEGEIAFGPIVGKAIGALLLTLLACGVTSAGHEENFMFTAAGIAAVVAFLIQASASWGRLVAQRRPRPPGAGPSGMSADDVAAAPRDGTLHAAPEGSWRAPIDPPQLSEALQKGLRPRGGFVRFFWAMSAFVLSGGAIVTFVMSLLARDMAHHDMTGVVVGCVGCGVMAIFAMSKTTPWARIGFWRGLLRPLLICLMMFGIGASITGIAREWDHCDEWSTPGAELPTEATSTASAAVAEARRKISAKLERLTERSLVVVEDTVPRSAASAECLRYTLDDAGRVGLVSGLVLCSLVFLGLLVLTRGRPRAPQTFLQREAT